MFTPRAAVRAFLCLDPVDMRLSFDRLAALAEEVVGQDPAGGHLFLFHARRRDRLNTLSPYCTEWGYSRNPLSMASVARCPGVSPPDKA